MLEIYECIHPSLLSPFIQMSQLLLFIIQRQEKQNKTATVFVLSFFEEVVVSDYSD